MNFVGVLPHPASLKHFDPNCQEQLLVGTSGIYAVEVTIGELLALLNKNSHGFVFTRSCVEFLDKEIFAYLADSVAQCCSCIDRRKPIFVGEDYIHFVDKMAVIINNFLQRIACIN
jgi:hypothetical protein